MLDINASWNRISQLDRGRRFRDIATGRATPDISNMDLGEAREFNLAVMHADMDNSTGVTRNLSYTGKLRLLNIYLSELTAAVRSHGGFVEKYVGDGITALFGAGKGGPEAVKNAVECAMTIQAEAQHVMGKYLKKIGLSPFTCSIGMDYGTIWVARVGVRGASQLTLVGNEVNVAKELEELAEPGETFVGECFWSRLGKKYQGYCKRQPASEDFTWTLPDGNDPYPYYKYSGEWVVRNE